MDFVEVHGSIVDFYEEILTLIDTLTINTISPLMWQVFYIIKEAFFRDAADYFAGAFLRMGRVELVHRFSRSEEHTSELPVT